MISDAEIAVEFEQIEARICMFRQRLAQRPDYQEATVAGFLIGLKAAQDAINAGYQCMKSGATLPLAVIEIAIGLLLNTKSSTECRQSWGSYKWPNT